MVIFVVGCSRAHDLGKLPYHLTKDGEKKCFNQSPSKTKM